MLITALNPCGLPYGVSLNSGFPSGTRIPREGKVLPEGTMASMLTPEVKGSLCPHPPLALAPQLSFLTLRRRALWSGVRLI